MSIRVLHVVTYMGRGGLETMIMNYYRHIDRSKVQFDFLVHRDFEADYDQEILSLGGKIYRLPPLNPFSRTYRAQLDDFFDKHREYKIVHSHLDCMAGIPLKSAKKYGVPVCIAHAHSSSQTKDGKYFLKLYYRKEIPKFADFLFACGKQAGEWMFKDRAFWILNNAIDTEKYRYSSVIARKKRKEMNIPEDAFVIGHVGNLLPPKNHVFLADIFNEIKKVNTNAYLLLIGEGKLRSEIEKKIENLGLKDSVILTGKRSDVNELLQVMDVFVFPSLYEGLPLSLIEAQAAGLICFISDKVPIECKKTSKVFQISLTCDAQEWAEIIMKSATGRQENACNEIIDSGFDIKQNTRALEQFYKDCFIYKDQKEKIQWRQ